MSYVGGSMIVRRITVRGENIESGSRMKFWHITHGKRIIVNGENADRGSMM